MSDARPGSFGASVRGLLDAVDTALDETLPQAAKLLLDVIAHDGLVYVGGAGHSLGRVAETFYRAGGLACVRPLYHPDLLPLTNAALSTRAERTPGLGVEVLDAADPGSADLLVVFSTSGRNPYPVELATRAREREVPVIAVTSRRASAGAADRGTAARLADLATAVLDTCVPAGDVVFPAEDARTAAVSTVTAAYVWGRLLAEVDTAAAEAGIELPRWHSANLPNGDAANQGLFERYGALIPELGAASAS